MQKTQNSLVIWVALLFGLTLYRFLVIDWTHLSLDLEEAYYLHWSSQLDWGYFSKPPMIAWLLSGMTTLFGDSEQAVKALSLLLHLGTALLIVSLGKRLYNREIGWIGGVFFFSLPLVGGLSLYSTTDAPLHFFWALTLRLFVEARDSRKMHWWLLTGLAAGLGLLSKYTMGVLALGLLGYVLAQRERRVLLQKPGLWLGLWVAALVFAPNIIWNWQSDFVSVQHTAHIAQLDKAWLRPDKFIAFMLPQFLLLGPLGAWFFFRVVRKPAVSAQTAESDSLLLWASLPMFGVIGLQALLAEANVNWASAGFIGVSLWLTARLVAHYRRWIKWILLLNLSLLSVLYHYHALADWVGIELKRTQTPYHRQMGWPELGEKLKSWTHRYPNAVLLSDSRKVLAFLSYYGLDKRRETASWNPTGRIRHQYDLWGDISQKPDQNYLFLREKPLSVAEKQAFLGVIELGVLVEPIFPDRSLHLYGYLVSGFWGYPNSH